MLPSSSLSAKDQLRRSKSTRSIRRNHRSSFSSEPFDPDLARLQATAAASQAMRRSNERSSMESKRSYDRLGGPENLAVPSRRRPVENPSVRGDDEEGSSLSAACYVQNQDTYPVALGTINEFGGLDGRMSSLPSSYRRLRKARSMFSTRQPTVSRLPKGISSEAFGCGPRASQEGQEASIETPRMQGSLRRSMSFLRGGGIHPSRPIRHSQSQDASIQLARSQFSRSREPSLTNLKPRREHKPFRRTFRSVSGSVMDDTGTPHSEKSKSSARIHGKARTFSSTIKKGLKRVLGISKPAEEHVSANDLPADQPQWDEFQSSKVGIQDYAPDSDFGSPIQEYSPARPPTMRSARSNDSLVTSRSRVTSWADSTAVPTITNGKSGNRNPLSIINESEIQTPGGRSRQGSPGPPNTSVDGQRLYSALMKHIGRNQTDDGDEDVSLGRVKEHRPIPERASSLHPCRSRQTIQHIPSDDSMASPLSFATASGSKASPVKKRSRQSNRHGYQYPRSPQSAAYDCFDEDSSSVRRQPAGTLFAIGEDFDDESNSIIVDRVKNEKQEDSPSVYSRATSSDAENTDPANPTEEPGIAMIYESQRSVYSSPKRSGNSSSAAATPTRSSADWQKWMKSQMERIEPNAARGHYREKAQIDDNDDDVNTINSLALGPNKDTMGGGSEISLGLSDKTPAPSNFSRPFSRSSSIRTIAAPPRSHADDSNVAGGLSLSARASNRLPQPPESPTPKRGPTDSSPSRRLTGQFRRYPTSRVPFSLQAKAAPFQPMRRSPWDSRHVTDENVKEGRSETSSPYRRQTSYSPVSSRQMVDDFLDSRRRRRMEGNNEGSSSGAFV